MSSTQKNLILKTLAIVIALGLVVTASVLSKTTSLKASENVMQDTIIEEEAEQIYEPLYEPDETWIPEKDAEVIVTEEVKIEDISEEPAAKAERRDNRSR